MAATGNIYAGLIYPIIVALMTVVVGGLWIRETKDVRIWDEVGGESAGREPLSEAHGCLARRLISRSGATAGASRRGAVTHGYHACMPSRSAAPPRRRARRRDGRRRGRARLPRATRSPGAGDGRLELAGVAVRSIDRGAPSTSGAELLSDAPAHLVADPEVDVVCELMGGDEPARTLIAAALGAGKAVVTANKHVIAHHGRRTRSDRSPHGRPAPLRGRGRRRHPGRQPARRRPRREPCDTDPGDPERHDQRDPLVDGGARRLDHGLRAAQNAGYAEADPTGDVEGATPRTSS